MKNKTFLSIFLFFLFSVASAWAAVEEYTIDYITNGGSLADSADNPQYYTVEDAIELPFPNREHYIFGGWFDKEGEDGKRVEKIAKGSTGNITLYARWTPIEYKITYELNGGELPNNVPNPQIYTFESDDIDFPKPFKIGYEFAGWLDECGNNFGMKIYSHSTGDVILYAKWEEQPPTNLAALEGNYTVQNGEVLTGKLAGNYKISIAEGATVTLNGVTIDGVNDENYEWAGITCEGNCNIILAGDSKNSVKGFYDEYPGIYVPLGKTLTISGTGSLEASSNGYGAGIGGGWRKSAGNIVINGGAITAMGGKYAAGIGGSDGTVGDISISGGSVTATGGENGPGIGGGSSGTVGNITISGGTVTAEGGYKAAGIGSGNEGTVGNITISGDETKIVATKIGSESYSIGRGLNGSRTGTITIGGVETSDIVTDPFEYPYLMLVHEDGDGKHAIFNGEYIGESSVNIPSDIEVASVEFNRTFTVDKFSTIVLPFKIAANKVEGAYFYMIDSISVEIVGNDTIWGPVRVSKVIGEIEANTPYLLEPSKTKLTFKGPVTLNTSKKNPYGFTKAGVQWEFRGTYHYFDFANDSTHLVGKSYGFVAKDQADGLKVGQFRWTSSESYILPMRAYLVCEPAASKSAAKPQFVSQRLSAPRMSVSSIPETLDVEIVDKDGGTTVIGKLDTHTGEIRMNARTADRWFDLQGRVLKGKPTVKGRYLHNGRVEIIK